jgi:membrane-bound serine protease (ClpP class)
MVLAVPIILVLLLPMVPGLAMAAAAPASPAKTAIWLDIQGPIGPATSDYVKRSLKRADRENAALVILRMDTPGGLDTAMREIIQGILSSTVPVVTYVSPSGARAASAGTYILYASHVAAMAPATNLGAATPVQIGGMPGMPSPGEPKKPGKEMKPAGGTMAHKMINDATAYIRGLAELRGRNADWAEKAVREAASLSAKQALKMNVVDLIATDMSDLLKKLNGRKVNVLGRNITLDTQGLLLTHITPDWRSKLLGVITNPNVAYILMLIGIYGLIFEFTSPGAIVPGVTGAICLLLALYAFQALPVNYAGFGLIILGILLMVSEAFVPSFGALGIGGVIAFVVGSIILMDTDTPGYGVSLPLIATFGFLSSALFTLILVMAIKSRRRPVVSGQEELVGALGEVINDFDAEGSVRVHSEIWSAQTEFPLHKGQKVRVKKMDGLILWVEPLEEQTAAEG